MQVRIPPSWTMPIAGICFIEALTHHIRELYSSSLPSPLTGYIAIPSFASTDKNWAAYLVFLMMWGAVGCQAPPGHLLMQLLGILPTVM